MGFKAGPIDYTLEEGVMYILSRMAIVFTLLYGFATTGLAQDIDFPTKPVRIISPYPPGGGNDIVSRIMADNLTRLWGETVIVENRPGAGGNVGTDYVAKSDPDGYTWIMGSLSHTINASIYSDLRFDPLTDFAPITMLASGSYMLVSHPSLPASNVQELVSLAKDSPGTLNYASAGNGSGTHLGMEMFKAAADIDIVHIPYKGTGPAINATLAGEVSLDMDNMLALSGQVKAERLRPLAVTSLKRSSLFPDVPTLDESGYKGFEVSPWFGLLAPAGTPESVIAKINQACVQVLSLPDVREQLRAQGADVVANSPREFADFLHADFSRWAKVVEATGAHID